MALANVQVTRVAVVEEAEHVVATPSMKACTAPAVSTVAGAGTFTVIVAPVSELLGTPESPEGMAPSADVQNEAKPGSNTHVVKPGETLYRISRRYGVKVDTLRKWNKLPDDIIEVGQKLIVSQEP